MKTLLLTAVCLSFVAQANADELLVHTWSYHTNSSYRDTTNYVLPNGTVAYSKTREVAYNNTNPGVGYRTDSGYMVGYYENSYHKNTFYAASEFMLTPNFGGFIGVGTGYSIITGHAVNPIGGLEYKMHLTDTVTANVLALPPLRGSTGVFHLVLSQKL